MHRSRYKMRVNHVRISRLASAEANGRELAGFPQAKKREAATQSNCFTSENAGVDVQSSIPSRYVADHCVREF